MTRNIIKNAINRAIQDLQRKKIWSKFEALEILIERPEDSVHGDYATNIALQIAKILKKKPMEIAQALVSQLTSLSVDQFKKIEAKEPGFINFFLSKEYLQEQVGEILKRREKFGQVAIRKDKKINIEFISANPTGPLHVGNARGGFCGDVLANVLKAVGYKVRREYYVNDMGTQIEILENSLYGREPAYKNPYIDYLKAEGIRDVKKAVKFIINEIKKTTARMGIKFDKWFFESSLYPAKVNKILRTLQKKKLTYRKEGALWFRSSEFGDDKDRVLKRVNEKETYFLSELAYLQDKFQRRFDKLIIFLGAEHHGYIARLKAGVKALGYEESRVDPVIYQLVHLLEGGKEVKMSKRTGTYITIDELLDEVGRDVARFFFLVRRYGSHLNFDLDLAKQQSEKNPVYYVQYAHARICAILRKCGNSKFKTLNFKQIQNSKSQNFRTLTHPSELALIKQLIRLPEIIEDTAGDYQVQRLPQYAIDLATAFHAFYRDCRVISDDRSLTQARLDLVLAAKTILKNILDLMGISAPERM